MSASRLAACGGLVLALAAGCGDSGPTLAQVSGTVTFKGQPVPTGYVTFTPPAGTGTVVLVPVKDGKYDTAAMPGPNKGVYPGENLIRVGGFDGKPVKNFDQGKQIFNPVDEKYTVPPGTSTKDFVVPESAGKNIRFEPTSDF